MKLYLVVCVVRVSLSLCVYLQIPFVLEKGPDNPYSRLWSLIAMQYIAGAVDRCVCVCVCVCMCVCV